MYCTKKDPNRWPHGFASSFATLSEDDRATLRSVASMIAHDAVFGVLAVFDGVRVVEDTPEKGEFRLTFLKDGQEWELNPPDGIPLHDLLNQEP